MSRPLPGRLVGVAGPDGSGKSTLAARLACESAPGARRAPTIHPYGCVICRRRSGRPRSAGGASTHDSAAPVWRRIRSLHAVADAMEMTIRILGAALLARARGAELLITDRTPLDALIKHDPCPGSLAGRWYLALSHSYATLLWLDAEPTTLAARDGDHAAAELAIVRERFQRWAGRVPHVVRIDTDSIGPDEVLERSATAAGLRRSRAAAGANDRG